MNPVRMFHLLPLVVIAAVAAPVSAQEAVHSDRILPQDTYLHFTIISVEDAKRQFEESPFGQMINDPALADFRAELENAFSGPVGEAIADVEAQLEMSVDEILQIPSGEVSLSIASAGNHVGLVLHVDIGDSQEQVDKLLGMAEQALSQVPQLALTVNEFDGTEIKLYEVQEQVPTPLLKEFGWFVRDGHLVISSSNRVMEAMISNWGGSAPESLSSNEKYAHVLSRLESAPGSADSIAYFDPIGLITKLSQTGSFGEAQLVASMAIAQLPLLGLNQLQAFAMVTEEADGDLQIVNRAMVYAEQPPAGLMRVFMFEPVSAVPPSWVKEDAVMYMSTKWQVAEAYTAIEGLIDGFQGPGTLSRIIDQASEDGPGVHIKTDLIDQLTGELQMVGGAVDTATGANEMLFAVGVQDPEAFVELLARVSEEPGFPAEIRDFRGYTVYEIAQEGASIGVTVANGSLLISVGQQILEQVLRNDDDVRPLAESEEYQKISQHFPSKVVAVNFTRPAEQYRSLYEMLQSGNAADQFPGMDELFSQIDFTTLPPYEAISKYLAPTGGFTVEDENGYVSEGYSLRP